MLSLHLLLLLLHSLLHRPQHQELHRVNGVVRSGVSPGRLCACKPPDHLLPEYAQPCLAPFLVQHKHTILLISLLLPPYLPPSSSLLLPLSPDGQAYTFKMAFSNNTSLEQHVAGQAQMREPL